MRCEYYFPLENPETVLLTNMWEDRGAIDSHHTSSMMGKIMALLEKYDLKMRVERLVSDETGLPEKNGDSSGY